MTATIALHGTRALGSDGAVGLGRDTALVPRGRAPPLRAARPEDIAQEAVIRAFRNRHSCRTPDRPWAWLSAITQREALRRHERPQRHELPCAEPAEPCDLDPALEATPERLAIRDALRTLSAAERAIALMHYEQDMTVASIARAVDMPVGTVKVKLLRIRDKLRNPLLS